MLKAIIRTAALIVLVVLVARLFPAFAPYQTIAIAVALITGLFGFIARSLFILLLIAAAIAAYFFFF
ncbi:MAG: hypothetical protein Q7R71_00480 [bacterium]|nr:hypothetical protein [bacterium]